MRHSLATRHSMTHYRKLGLLVAPKCTLLGTTRRAGANAGPLGVDPFEDAVRAIPVPVGVAHGAHHDRHCLSDVEALIEHEETDLPVAGLQPILAETSGDRDDIDRPIL